MTSIFFPALYYQLKIPHHGPFIDKCVKTETLNKIEKIIMNKPNPKLQIPYSFLFVFIPLILYHANIIIKNLETIYCTASRKLTTG